VADTTDEHKEATMRSSLPHHGLLATTSVVAMALALALALVASCPAVNAFSFCRVQRSRVPSHGFTFAPPARTTQQRRRPLSRDACNEGDGGTRDVVTDAEMERLEKARWPLAQKFFKRNSPVRAKVRDGDEVYVLRWCSECDSDRSAYAYANGNSGPRTAPIVAAVRLTFKPAVGATFLHSMAVSKGLRGRGLGSTLMQALQTDGALGSTPAYCFAFDHLLAFYGRYGFRIAELDQTDAGAAAVHPLVLSEFHREKARRSNLVLMIRPPNDA